MKNLLLSLGITAGLGLPFQNVIINNLAFKQDKINYKTEEPVDFDFTFSHLKHWDNDKFLPGRQDYANEFWKAYKDAVKTIKDHAIQDPAIRDFSGYLIYDTETPINFSEDSKAKLLKVLKGNKVEIKHVYIDIDEQTYQKGSKGIRLFSYNIIYSVEVDGIEINGNLSVYNNKNLFSENIFSSPYKITLSFMENSFRDDYRVRWKVGGTKDIQSEIHEDILGTYINVKTTGRLWYLDRLERDKFRPDLYAIGNLEKYSISNKKRPLSSKIVWVEEPPVPQPGGSKWNLEVQMANDSANFSDDQSAEWFFNGFYLKGTIDPPHQVNWRFNFIVVMVYEGKADNGNYREETSECHFVLDFIYQN